jgi:hypothetical protein
MKLGIRFMSAAVVAYAAYAELSPASAQRVITVCGPSKGWTYSLHQQTKERGFSEDAISRGSLTFMVDASGRHDVILKDAATTFSARGDGATIVRAEGMPKNELMLIAAYPLGTIETYQLVLNDRRRGTLI